MFAILAAIAAAVGLFGGHILGLNLVYLILLFIALEMVFGFARPYFTRRP